MRPSPTAMQPDQTLARLPRPEPGRAAGGPAPAARRWPGPGWGPRRRPRPLPADRPCPPAHPVPPAHAAASGLEDSPWERGPPVVEHSPGPLCSLRHATRLRVRLAHGQPELLQTLVTTCVRCVSRARVVPPGPARTAPGRRSPVDWHARHRQGALGAPRLQRGQPRGDCVQRAADVAVRGRLRGAQAAQRIFQRRQPRRQRGRPARLAARLALHAHALRGGRRRAHRRARARGLRRRAARPAERARLTIRRRASRCVALAERLWCGLRRGGRRGRAQRVHVGRKALQVAPAREG